MEQENLNTIPQEKDIKILVVDDDTNLRETMSELLEIEGYDVYQAGSAKECLDLVRNTFFSLTILRVKRLVIAVCTTAEPSSSVSVRTCKSCID